MFIFKIANDIVNSLQYSEELFGISVRGNEGLFGKSFQAFFV